MSTIPDNSTRRLCFWRSRCGLISLRDVKTYLAKRLVSINERLMSCHFIGMDIKAGEVPTKDQAEGLGINLKSIAEESEHLSLPLTAILARRMADKPPTEKDNTFHDQIGELTTRFEDELGSKKLFLVSPESFSYYENTVLAGEEFKTNFPTGNAELIEAGNCMVLDRHTACVFHLMRALDISLAALEKHIGVIPPPAGPERTWGKTLGRIKAVIEDNNRTPPAGWLSESEFVEKAYAFIQAVKNPYRDATMHVKSSYDEASARSVFNVTVEALKYIASRLKE